MMNQYLQGRWSGLYNKSEPIGKINKAPDTNGTFTPFNPDAASSPADVILLFEGAQEKAPGQSYDGSVNRYGTAFFQGFTGSCTSYANDTYGNIPCLQPADYHNGVSDFLFLDGHVKALHPNQTYTQATANFVASQSGGTFPSVPSAVDYYTTKHGQGPGTVDMWNPNLSGTQMYVTNQDGTICFP